MDKGSTRVENGGATAGTYSSNGGFVDLGLRVAALGATLIAATVMGKDKQTISVFGTPAFEAIYSYSPALVFFVVANLIACVYGILSIPISLIKGKCSAATKFVVFLLDLVMVALVMAGASAAAAIAYVGKKGNSHTHWSPICNIFDRFCDHIVGAVVASLIAVIIFMLLTTMSAISLYKHNR